MRRLGLQGVRRGQDNPSTRCLNGRFARVDRVNSPILQSPKRAVGAQTYYVFNVQGWLYVALRVECPFARDIVGLARQQQHEDEVRVDAAGSQAGCSIGSQGRADNLIHHSEVAVNTSPSATQRSPRKAGVEPSVW